MTGRPELADAMGALNIGSGRSMGGAAMSNLDMPQMISLEMSAMSLKKKDLVGKSDSVCYVFVPEDRVMRDGRAESPADIRWKVLSRTEVIKNSHSRTWGNRVCIAYVFQDLFALIDPRSQPPRPRARHCRSR